MELALLVYFIGIINPLITLLGLAAFLLLVVVGIHTICTMDTNRKPTMLKWGLPTVLSLALLIVVIPTEKTAYTMVAAYAAQKVAEDPKVQKLSGKVLNILEAKLDGYIADMSTAKEKKATN